ncbi:MAG TPA: hypothetical protein VFJ74_12690 [Gemmatimonadaceae bacterium]|nr:hypothetical protein [Gemmatimonadaceae bacterium]
MHSSARSLLSLGTSLLTLVVAVPSVASAQGTLRPVHVTAAPVENRGAQYQAEAEALPTRIDQFAKAARLYERSALARPADDTATATCLRMAAFLHYYSGDSRAGASLMEKAARRAAEFGDVAVAAGSYIDAAIIAAEADQGEHALDLGRRAEQLTKSPLLTDSQRDALKIRMAGWHEVAVALEK